MAEKPTFTQLNEFRSKLLELGFEREYRFDDNQFEKYFGMVKLRIRITETKKREFKSLEAHVFIPWVDYLRSNGLPANIDLGKPCRQLDMSFVMKCETVSARIDEEISSLKDRVILMAKKMELPKDTKKMDLSKDNGQWLTNGNTDTDDRVDDAQSWGIFQ